MKRFLLKLFQIGSCILVLTYLASCLTPFVHSKNWLPLSLLALVFPFTAICLLFCCFFWLFIHRRTSIMCFLIFMAGYKNLTSVFAFEFAQTFTLEKQPESIRVLSWNIHSMGGMLRKNEVLTAERREIISFFKKVNADVLMLQEFSEYDENKYSYSNLKVLSDTLGYKYFVMGIDRRHPGRTNAKFGSIILSKLPLKSPCVVNLPDVPAPEMLVSTDLVVNNKIIKLFTFHLVSMNLAKVYNERDPFVRKDIDFILSSSVTEKLVHFDSVHANQAQFIRRNINQSAHPVIVAGDFNATPATYTYHHIKGSLTDVFSKKGLGLGPTYPHFSRSLRIDYLLVDPAFKVHQYYSPQLPLSDHYPVVSDISLQ